MRGETETAPQHAPIYPTLMSLISEDLTLGFAFGLVKIESTWHLLWTTTALWKIKKKEAK